MQPAIHPSIHPSIHPASQPAIQPSSHPAIPHCLVQALGKAMMHEVEQCLKSQQSKSILISPNQSETVQINPNRWCRAIDWAGTLGARACGLCAGAGTNRAGRRACCLRAVYVVASFSGLLACVVLVQGLGSQPDHGESRLGWRAKLGCQPTSQPAELA